MYEDAIFVVDSPPEGCGLRNANVWEARVALWSFELVLALFVGAAFLLVACLLLLHPKSSAALSGVLFLTVPLCAISVVAHRMLSSDSVLIDGTELVVTRRWLNRSRSVHLKRADIHSIALEYRRRGRGRFHLLVVRTRTRTVEIGPAPKHRLEWLHAALAGKLHGTLPAPTPREYV